MSPFGRYLQLLRINRQIKQKDLAFIVGINASYISAIEQGHKSPPSKHVRQKITASLKLSIEEAKLFEGYAVQSMKEISLPDNLSADAYVLMYELQNELSHLSIGQINVIRTVLKLNNETEEISYKQEVVM